MRLLTMNSSEFMVLPMWEREPPELKHHSKGRKRNQNGIPPLTASEKGKVQTESRKETYERCSVAGPAAFSPTKPKWPGKACHRR